MKTLKALWPFIATLGLLALAIRAFIYLLITEEWR